MKKILAILGSSRKNGIGAKSLELFMENFSGNDYEFETLYLSDATLKPCIGCTTCFKNSESKCPLDDDVLDIVDKMKAADGLIFVTPVYEMNVSSTMKLLLDRTAFTLHRPSLYNKHSFIIISTDIAGIKPVSVYLKYMMNALGINNAGSIGVQRYRFERNKDYQQQIRAKLSKNADNFKKEIKKGSHYRPSFLQLVRFNGWRIKNAYSKDIYPEDYQYWKEQGWLEADYYYPVKINPFHRLLLKIIKKRLSRTMRKGLDM